MDKTELPTGTVTFLFTDIEGSTRLLGQLGHRFTDVLETHHSLLRSAFRAAEGVEVQTEGDAFFVAFTVAGDAVSAAIEAQRALAGHRWPVDGRVRVRMGMHTGEGVLGGDSYAGMDVHRAARIGAAAHGGQVIVSDTTRALCSGSAALAEVSFRDLGEHRLKDLPEPEHLYQVQAPGLDTEFPPVRSLDARRGNLPAELTTFVGREQQIEEVVRAIEGRRLVTLTGPGGTGKTRLSLHVARVVEERFADGAFFVALAPLREPGLVPAAIAQALGLRQEPARPAIETVIDHLRDKRALVVLDNFEQVMEAAADVARLLEAAPASRLVVTSREPLHLQGEQEHPVPPLTLPDPQHLPSLQALTQFEAVSLFIDRARAVRPGFEVTTGNAPAVAEICARLDGLPLAIELAAARVKVLSPEAILGRLESRLTLLAGGARDLPARQQTLRGAIGWSYDLLGEDEQPFFARLAAFAGGCTLEAVEAVCAEGLGLDSLDGVASLVNKSLLRQSERSESRFFMLETIREFATERLADLPNAAETHRRHAAYFLVMAEEAASELLGPKQAALLDTLEEEHDNLRTALTWAAKAGELATALRIGGALWRFWQMRGYLREGADRLGAIVDHPDAERDPAALAIALEGAGGIAYWMGRWEDAKRFYEACLALQRETGNRSGTAEALYNLSFCYTVPLPPVRDTPKARRLIDEALAIFRELDDRHGMAKALWAGSAVAESVQGWSESRAAATQALEVFRELDDRFSAAWAYHSIGLASTQLGLLDEGEAAIREGLRQFGAAGDVTGLGQLLWDMSVLEARRGRHERAARLRGAAFSTEKRGGQALVSTLEGYIPDIESLVRGPLSRADFDRLISEGAALGDEEAQAYALRGASADPPG
jgi:predicted ATPase/class 3 adenylate cyclase